MGGGWGVASRVATGRMKDCVAAEASAEGGGDMEKAVKLRHPRSEVERIWKSSRATGYQ